VIVEGLSTMAERSRRAGRIKPVQRPAMTRSIGRRFGALAPRPIENQELMFEQKRLGDNGTSAATAKESGDRGDEMDEKFGRSRI